MFAAYALALERAPVPYGVQIGNERGAARQDYVVAVLLQRVGGVFEGEPVGAGHFGAINREAHEVWRRPIDDRLLDGSVVEVAGSLGACAAALQHAAHGHGEASVHQERFLTCEAVERLEIVPHAAGIRGEPNRRGDDFPAGMSERGQLDPMACKNQNRHRKQAQRSKCGAFAFEFSFQRAQSVPKSYAKSEADEKQGKREQGTDWSLDVHRDQQGHRANRRQKYRRSSRF